MWILRIIYFFVFILISGLISGCNRVSPSSTKRVITLTPSLTETVCRFQKHSSYQIVATDKYSTDSCVQTLPKLDTEGSLENIIALKPDLVLMHSSQSIMAEKLKKLNIEVGMYDMDTIPKIQQAWREIAQILEVPEEAEILLKEVSKQRSATVEHSMRTQETSPSILIIVDRLDARMQQFYTATPPAYLADIVKDCGFNIQTTPLDSASGWTRMESETLISLNPSDILYLARNHEDAKNFEEQFIKQYAMLDAVKTHHLFVYDDPQITIPGPNLFTQQSKLCQFLRSPVDY